MGRGLGKGELWEEYDLGSPLPHSYTSSRVPGSAPLADFWPSGGILSVGLRTSWVGADALMPSVA